MTKRPQLEQGIAMRANNVVMFDADDGTQLTPCLRKLGKKVDVEVGFVWVAGPRDGARPDVAWVRC